MAFFHHTPAYVGIDFGSGGIKLVELIKEHGKPRLVTYGLAEVERNIARDESAEGRARTVTLLRDLIKQTKMTAKQVVASIPDFSVFTEIVRLPVMPDNDMRQAVLWEAKKIIPVPLEEVNIDWQVIGEEETKNVEAKPQDAAAPAAAEKIISRRVLLTAAPKKVVSRYVEILKEVGLEVASLETESFALIRSLVGYDPSTVLLVDIGAVVTHLAIVEKDIPVLTRSIDVGGKTISQAIANVLGVDVKRAEQFKRLHGIPLTAVDNASGVPKAITSAIQTILQETQYLIQTYARQGEGKIEKVILTGGSSLLPGLPGYLERQLNKRVFIGDPFARVVYPLDIQPILQELGSRLSVSVGLAMWGMGE